MSVLLKPANEWGNTISTGGLKDIGARLVLDKDPVYNTLMGFEKL